ncbi:hypothetical protein F4808DRAFT_69148 [Astrocystis sublimbata]|nr:hypothetical protein F4808DRAFT_69148 [Astrocystis sublimbata]
MAQPSHQPERPVKELRRPSEHDLYEARELHWPAYSVGMRMPDLWGSLHDDYNTLRISIQCQRAFHLDVRELATAARSHDEFHRLMAERSDARFREVASALDDIGVSLVMTPDRIPYDLWTQFIQFGRSMSAADLAVFLAGFEDPEHVKARKRRDERVAAQRVEMAAKTSLPACLPPPMPESPTTAPAPAPVDPPTPPDSIPPSDRSPVEASVQHPEPTPPTSPSVSHNTRDNTQHLPKPSPPRRSSRQTRPRKQTTDDIVKRNLRPRPAGIAQQKPNTRSQRRKRP